MHFQIVILKVIIGVINCYRFLIGTIQKETRKFSFKIIFEQSVLIFINYIWAYNPT